MRPNHGARNVRKQGVVLCLRVPASHPDKISGVSGCVSRVCFCLKLGSLTPPRLLYVPRAADGLHAAIAFFATAAAGGGPVRTPAARRHNGRRRASRLVSPPAANPRALPRLRPAHRSRRLLAFAFAKLRQSVAARHALAESRTAASFPRCGAKSSIQGAELVGASCPRRAAGPYTTPRELMLALLSDPQAAAAAAAAPAAAGAGAATAETAAPLDDQAYCQAKVPYPARPPAQTRQRRHSGARPRRLLGCCLAAFAQSG